MAIDRSVRSLTSLANASSSRVLNLTAIGLAQTENPEHRKNPLFVSPIINGAIIIKHRLRADEADMFSPRRTIATKVIVPFERTDLKQGGRSLFIGQRGFEGLLREVGNYGDKLDVKRDMDVLRLIDTVPSLDPFLLREHLRGNGYSPASCYFEISDSDQQRMFAYASAEISRLTRLATSGQSVAAGASTARMVAALLSSEVNEKLEPMRATLNLQPEEFSEGVFSWRGFIYYKWSLGEFWPRLIKTLREVKTIEPFGRASYSDAAFLKDSKQIIIRGAKDTSDSVREIIKKYDDAYGGLLEQQDARLFREFLLNAPELFLEMGTKMGAMAHVTSFWSYRFPDGATKYVDCEELVAIFQDFTKSFGEELAEAA